jgi:preprotein translocase subunit SecG
VVSGIALLKKLEAVGSETGNPSYQVKIVDCGEVSNTNSQDPLKGDKGINRLIQCTTANIFMFFLLIFLIATFCSKLKDR